MNIKLSGLIAFCTLSGCIFSAEAALSIDRSRLIYNEGDKSISVNVTNRNAQDPYLAQGWMEDKNEKKLSGPLMVLPPVQRVEAGGKTMVRIQALPDIASLPKNVESVFYFNLREIPPKSERPNVLMLAMQTRLKVFFRPKAIKVDAMADVVPGAESISLKRQGDKWVVHNPTPYYFSFVEARTDQKSKAIDDFDPVMVEPKGSLTLPLGTAKLSSTPALVFVNDYGSQRLIPFSCSGDNCKAGKITVPEHKTVVAPVTQNSEKR